jgi:MFS family permease
MSIYLITVLNLLNGMSLRGSRVLLSLFAIRLGASAFEIGLLIALGSVMQLLLGVTAGQASDRFGFRLPMVLGSVGGTVALVIPYFFPTLPGLYVSRILTGSTFIFFMVSLQNLAATIDGPDKRAANLTTYSLGQAVSGLAGPVAVGFAIDHFGHRYSYLMLAALACIPLLSLGMLRSSIPSTPRKAKHKGESTRVTDLLRIPELRRTLFSGSMIFAASDLLNFYMPIYGHSIGLSASVIGIIIGAHSAAAFVVRLVMPKLLKLATEPQLMNYCLVASGFTYFLFPLFQNPWLLAATAFLLGLSLGCGQPLAMILIYETSPPGRSGESLGLRMSLNKVVQIGVPLLFGSIGSALGLIAVFWSNGILLLSGARKGAQGLSGQPQKDAAAAAVESKEG